MRGVLANYQGIIEADKHSLFDEQTKDIAYLEICLTVMRCSKLKHYGLFLEIIVG